MAQGDLGSIWSLFLFVKPDARCLPAMSNANSVPAPLKRNGRGYNWPTYPFHLSCPT
jgi:hypothetical protein